MRRLAAGLGVADLWAVLVAVLLLVPVWHGGYPLGRDMVFTPHQPLTLDSLGLGSAAPRAVPLDALVALLSRVADGAVVGRLLILAPLVLAGCGAWRLLPTSSAYSAGSAHPSGKAGTAGIAAALATAGFAVWNPFVVERLALGQWALLWCYGVLPWLVLATRAAVTTDPGRLRRWAGVVCALAACSITPTGGLIATVAAVVIAADRGRAGARHAVTALALAIVLQLPWLVPALTAAAGLTSDQGAVAAFASRAERPGGVVLSLLGLGGIWDSGSTPSSRGGLLGYLTTALILGVLVVGLPQLVGALGRWVVRYAVLSAAGLLLAAVTVVPGGAAVLRAAVRTVPGAGLLRDGQKWVLALALLGVLCLGATVQRVASAALSSDRAAAVRPVLLVVALALPLLLLPDAIRAARPTMTPAHYPSGWYQAAAEVDRSAAPGTVLGLPFASYRSFDWLSASSVIDPLPRWVDRPAVVQDRLMVDGHLLVGEDARAAAVAAIVQRDRRLPTPLAADLAGAGIAWVWVEEGTPGPPLPDLSGLTSVIDSPAVRLYRVPGAIAVQPTATGRRVAVAAADLLALITLGLAVGVLAVHRVRRCYTRR